MKRGAFLKALIGLPVAGVAMAKGLLKENVVENENVSIKQRSKWDDLEKWKKFEKATEAMQKKWRYDSPVWKKRFEAEDWKRHEAMLQGKENSIGTFMTSPYDTIIYNRALSKKEINTIYKYLEDKYF